MNDSADWHAQNARHLGAGLAWLRLRLSCLLAPDERFDQAALEEAKRALASAESVEPPPALVILRERFGLSRFEQDLLLLCAAPDLDSNIRTLLGRARGNPASPYPTFALGLSLFNDPAWDVLGPQAPLRAMRFIEIHQSGAEPLTHSPLRLDERILHFIKGLNYLDERLLPLLQPLDDESESGSTLLTEYGQRAHEICRTLEITPAGHRPPVVHLLGNDVLVKRGLAKAVADELGLRAYRLPAELLPTQAAELETLAALWQRESLLLPVALYFDATRGTVTAQTGDGPGTGNAALFDRFLARVKGLVFLDTRDPLPGMSHATLPIDVCKPKATEQQRAWTAALGTAAADHPTILGGQFDLSLATIGQIAAVSLAEPEPCRPLGERLWDGCLARTRPALDALAERLELQASWEDLVLPTAEMGLLQQIATQVRHRATVYGDWGFRARQNRGLGLSVLFTGESGTGKTLAAEVLACALRLNLYRIDLSAVVSKYIGETEKNLRRLFDAADEGGAILFFDEADALFGKRSEVKDSHDRYANIEINYLLQRMEMYCGLSILATNLKSALDASFLRRLRFVVPFPFPGTVQRRAIWSIAFPRAAPVEPLDLDRLVKFNLTGGSIHNIALSAAFLAAEARTNVTMPLILQAARAEFRKLERPINEADFQL
jgi:ATPase family associated with various cellular activities (AAA)